MKTFPMFLRMDDRRVVIVGGGEQAAQKCRLMLKTEARIHIVADRLDPELTGIVRRGQSTFEAGFPTEASFRGAALVFVATGCSGADAAVQDLAKQAGAVVNVVDQPDLCDAYTPSIVDRDPVVVAIGTEGTAPVLARQIKTRVEQILEPGLGDLAALAGRLRGAVAARVPPRKRRDFWRWAFSATPRILARSGDIKASARTLKQAIAAGGAPDDTPKGQVSLVGAGPGAADLLTLRAVQRLQNADIIFYDRLVDPAVLELARRDAERVYVGKVVGACKWPQERIDRLVVAAALRGQSVVRLKSGDPAVFGRADEEQSAARDAGVPVEIVPGVTAATAAAASLGRSLTCRGKTDRVILATGTCRDGDDAPGFADALRPGTTLALYMAARAAPRIQSELLQAGVPPSAEVQIVANASTTREVSATTTLSELSETLRSRSISHPVVILIHHPKTAVKSKDRSVPAQMLPQDRIAAPGH